MSSIEQTEVMQGFTLDVTIKNALFVYTNKQGDLIHFEATSKQSQCYLFRDIKAFLILAGKCVVVTALVKYRETFAIAICTV